MSSVSETSDDEFSFVEQKEDSSFKTLLYFNKQFVSECKWANIPQNSEPEVLRAARFQRGVISELFQEEPKKNEKIEHFYKKQIHRLLHLSFLQTQLSTELLMMNKKLKIKYISLSCQREEFQTPTKMSFYKKKAKEKEEKEN